MRHALTRKSLLCTAALAAAALTLSGCGGGSSTASSASTTPASSSSSESTASSEPAADGTATSSTDPAATSDTATSDASSGSESSASTSPTIDNGLPTGLPNQPAWAAGSLDAGEKIGSLKTKNFSVDVYQVGTGKLKEDTTGYNDPKKDLKAGTEVVYANFVFTNTSSKAIDLSTGLGTPRLVMQGWTSAGAMPGELDDSVFKPLGLSTMGYAFLAKPPYTVKPGETFSQATSVQYKAGWKGKATVEIKPGNKQGTLSGDPAETGEGSITLK